LDFVDVPFFLLMSTASAWDRLAHSYDSRLDDPIYMAGVSAAVEALKPHDSDRVLDAACGTGIPLRAYYRPGLRVCALDYSGDSLRALGAACSPVAGCRVQGDFLRLPFPDASFERVLCANALQHVPTAALRSACVGELARVTRPGGVAVISAHQWSVPKQRAGWKKEGRPGGKAEVEYIYRFEAGEFRDLLEPHFARITVRAAGFTLPYRRGLCLLCRLLERYARLRPSWITWGHMLVATCIR
jgi:ubiquinone/menaquinone biosynthesis C-methylase UbiE